MIASADDAECEQRGAAALNQPGDLVPVDVAGGALGQVPRDPKTRELCHPPVVHEEFIAVDGLVTGDRQDRFHGSALLAGWLYWCLHGRARGAASHRGQPPSAAAASGVAGLLLAAMRARSRPGSLEVGMRRPVTAQPDSRGNQAE